MEHLTPETVRELVDLAGTRDEDDRLAARLRKLSMRELAELKALIWIGREHDWPQHWDALVIEARSKVDFNTPAVLAESSDLANALISGLERMQDAGRI